MEVSVNVGAVVRMKKEVGPMDFTSLVPSIRKSHTYQKQKSKAKSNRNIFPQINNKSKPRSVRYQSNQKYKKKKIQNLKDFEDHKVNGNMFKYGDKTTDFVNFLGGKGFDLEEINWKIMAPSPKLLVPKHETSLFVLKPFKKFEPFHSKSKYNTYLLTEQVHWNTRIRPVTTFTSPIHLQIKIQIL